MIYVDASAIVAAILNEPSSDRIMAVIERRAAMISSGLGVYEAAMAIARVSAIDHENADAVVRRFLVRFNIQITAISDKHATAALKAAAMFGRKHPAKLNMGDCFAYAVAKSHDAAILFVGDDFTHTDLRDALAANT